MEFSSGTLESYFSLELFDFLCKLVGSERDVRARRIYFKVLDHALQYNPEWRVVTSGSKPEGLDILGSDLDIMYINQVDTVYNTQSEIPSDLPYGLFLDFENTPPGFVYIKLHLKNRKGLQPKHMYSGNHIMLSNEHYKQFIQKLNSTNDKSNVKLFSATHGPCSSTVCESYDFLSSYKCILFYRKCKLLKHICFLWFTKLCGSLAKYYPINLWRCYDEKIQNPKNNKIFYTDYKKCLWYTVLGTFSDSYTGWHLLAEFIFYFKQLKKTLQIIQLCQLKSSMNLQIITPDLKPHPKSKTLEKIEITFLKRYKLSCSGLFYLVPKANPQLMFYHEDIQFTWLNEHMMVAINPQIRMYYLLFLCHHYLGNNTEELKALRKLKEFTLQCSTCDEYSNSIMHLLLALNVAETIPVDFFMDFYRNYNKLPLIYIDYFCKQFKPWMHIAKNKTREMVQPLVDDITFQH